MAAKSQVAPGLPTPPPIEAVLKELAENNSRLEKLDLRISASISLVEKVLHKCVSVRICVPTGAFNDEDMVEYLAFGKHRGSWALLLEDHDRDDGIHNRTPLNSCSREVRARMFAGGHIETLIRSANKQIAEEIINRNIAIDVVERLVAVLPELPDVPQTQHQEEVPDDNIPF